MGPGNIASAALMAPIAMAVGGRAGVPAFLMAIMVGNGANAGSLSPFAPTGIIVNGLMAKIGMFGLGWPIYWTNLAAHAGITLVAYLLFGGRACLSSGAILRRKNPPRRLLRQRIPSTGATG